MAERLRHRHRSSRRARRLVRVHDRAHGAPNPRGKRVRHAHDRRQSASIRANGVAGRRRPERALACARQDLRRVARAAADAARERSQPRRRGAAAAAQAARRPSLQTEEGGLMLLAWMAYAALVASLVYLGAIAAERLVAIWNRGQRFIWIA